MVKGILARWGRCPCKVCKCRARLMRVGLCDHCALHCARKVAKKTRRVAA